MSARMYRQRCRVTFYLSRSELEHLRRHAEATQVSISRLVRTAVLRTYKISEVRHHA